MLEEYMVIDLQHHFLCYLLNLSVVGVLGKPLPWPRAHLLDLPAFDVPARTVNTFWRRSGHSWLTLECIGSAFADCFMNDDGIRNSH